MKKTLKKNNFDPIVFHPKQLAVQKRTADAIFKEAYDALEDEFSALQELLAARKDAGLTQAEVAVRMGVSQPVLARIESSLGNRKHTPSLNTLRRYAQACGKKLVIRMV